MLAAAAACEVWAVGDRPDDDGTLGACDCIAEWALKAARKFAKNGLCVDMLPIDVLLVFSVVPIHRFYATLL